MAEDKMCIDGKPHTWWRDPDGDLECLRCGELIEKKTPPKRGKSHPSGRRHDGEDDSNPAM